MTNWPWVNLLLFFNLQGCWLIGWLRAAFLQPNMTRPTLSELDTRRFDVAIIGAGVNGAAAAQHLAADGYQG